MKEQRDDKDINMTFFSFTGTVKNTRCPARVSPVSYIRQGLPSILALHKDPATFTVIDRFLDQYILSS